MIADLFRNIAGASPEVTVIIDGDRRITYREFSSEVDRTRAWLSTALRDGANGQVVAACLKNSWQFVATFLAVIENGGIFLPVNPSWRAAELRRFAALLSIGGVVTTELLRSEWDGISDLLPEGSILTWETALPCGSRVAPISRPADAPLAYLLTSGSAGVPKIVPRSGKNLNFAATHVADAIQMTPGTRWLSAIPFFHSWGLHMGMLLPLLRGGTLVILPQFHATTCAELIRRERVDVLMASPFAYSFLADAISDAANLATLQRCFWAGSRMNTSVGKTWADRFGLRLRPEYGMSEANAIAIDLDDGPKPVAEGFVGKAVPGVEIGVFDSTGERLGVDEIGEIGVRSDGVMSGYACAIEENQNAFYGPSFRTGDMGRVDASGNLYLSGRARMLINIAGIKVDANEIEQAIEMLDAVAGCRVDSIPGGPGGERMRAKILLREGREVSRREIVEHCRRKLAEYKIPRVIEFAQAASALGAGKMAR